MDELSVLFVGDSLHSDDIEANIKFYAMVNEIYQICCKLRIPFKYKGHPTEKTEEKRKYVKEYLSPDITCVDDLFGELRKNQIVVGCRTSALIDAGYIGNYVIQIYYDDKRQKDFVFNHCYLVRDYRNEFAPLLQAIVNKKILPKELSTYEFYQPDDLLLQFNKGLEQVERYYNM